MTPGNQDVEHHAHDDLVDQVLDAEHRQHHGHGRAGNGGRQQADEGVLGNAGHDGCRESAAQELALDGDVDHANALTEHTGQRAEHQRNGQRHGTGDEPGQRNAGCPGPAHNPDQEGCDKQHGEGDGQPGRGRPVLWS